MEPRYVAWRINCLTRYWEAVREEDGQVISVGYNLTLSDAYAVVDADRALVLADPMAVEVKPTELRSH